MPCCEIDEVVRVLPAWAGRSLPNPCTTERPARIEFMEAAVLAPPLLFVYYRDGVFTKSVVMCSDDVLLAQDNPTYSTKYW